MSLDPIVHHMTKAADAQAYAYKVTRITPITRLGCMGEAILLQGGQVFDEGGEVIANPPGWFYEQIARLSPAALKEAGFTEAPARPTSAVDVQSTLIQCPECHKLLEPSDLRNHMFKHKPAQQEPMHLKK